MYFDLLYHVILHIFTNNAIAKQERSNNNITLNIQPVSSHKLGTCFWQRNLSLANENKEGHRRLGRPLSRKIYSTGNGSHKETCQ